MLLLDARPVRQMNFRSAVFDDRQRCLDKVHGVLAGKAGADALGKVGVEDFDHRM